MLTNLLSHKEKAMIEKRVEDLTPEEIAEIRHVSEVQQSLKEREMNTTRSNHLREYESYRARCVKDKVSFCSFRDWQSFQRINAEEFLANTAEEADAH